MTITEILLTSIALAMDAFAVSICKGLSTKQKNHRRSLKIAIYFGLFQMIMPILGYLIGNSFKDFITMIDHYVVFVILGLIGFNMITDNNDNTYDEKTDFKTMIILAIATSIDAFSVGITLAFLNVNLFLSIFVIGLITFIICFIGVELGSLLGNKYQKRSAIFGGIILILIGLKILLEHLNILPK